MTFQLGLTIGLIVLISTVVILTGIKKQPGIGIIIALLVLGAGIGFNRLNFKDIGFFSPKNWMTTIIWGLGLGIILSALSTFIIEPAAEKLGNQPVDLDQFKRIRGKWKWFLFLVIVGGIVAPVLEETIFRGFLLSELAKLIGKSGPLITISLVISSVVFGLAHWYQGKSGVISTTILGMLLGDIFIWSGYNLWMPILTHSIINIAGLTLIFTNQDINLRKFLWKEKSS
jgi:membrane protease YdiL (CAAX protease family)